MENHSQPLSIRSTTQLRDSFPRQVPMSPVRLRDLDNKVQQNSIVVEHILHLWELAETGTGEGSDLEGDEAGDLRIRLAL